MTAIALYRSWYQFAEMMWSDCLRWNCNPTDVNPPHSSIEGSRAPNQGLSLPHKKTVDLVLNKCKSPVTASKSESVPSTSVSSRPLCRQPSI
jgi:hypothetical protein